MAENQRIGILGGSFDPVHRGHIQMALSVLDAGYVDRLLLVPSCYPAGKSCIAGPEDRWKMLVSACACDKRLIPSRLAIDRGGISCSFELLSDLRRLEPKVDLFFIIGSDTLLNLHSWRRLQEILPLCTFLVYLRSEGDRAGCITEMNRLSASGARLMIVPAEPISVSAVSIRASLPAAFCTEDLDISVFEYCHCKGLYGCSGKLDHIDKWMNQLFLSLKPKRFAHSLSVAYTARRLAEIHGINPFQAEQAGLLHDCAKCLPLPEMRRIASDHAVTDDQAFLSSDALLHSLVGAWMAENQYGMKDPEVLSAIAYHNTGHAGMSRLDMCVCLSDSIEPLRQSYPLLEEIRALAEISLERALLLSLESTAKYVEARGQFLHPRTSETIRWLKKQTMV